MSEPDAPAFDNETASIGGLEAQFADVNGTRTRYYEAGSDNDEPMVMTHGGSWDGTSSANTWTTNIPGLAESFHVHAADRIACGMTDNPDEYVYASEVAHMWDFIDEMGIDEFHLVGQSRGGGLAGRLAVEQPERIKTLVIVDSATLAPPWKDYQQRRELIFQNRPTDESSPTYIEDDYRARIRSLSYTKEHVTDEFVEAAGFMKRQPKAQHTDNALEGEGWDTYIESLEAKMDEARAWIRDGRLDMPTLIYWGRNDPSAVLEQGFMLYDMVAQTNPDARMEIINNAGHFHYREYPAEFNQTVTDFISYWND